MKTQNSTACGILEYRYLENRRADRIRTFEEIALSNQLGKDDIEDNLRNSRAEKSLFAYGLHPGTRIAALLTDAEAA